MVTVNIHLRYHCEQFDDWLAGSDFYYKGGRYYWSANDSNYGFGWEVEPIRGDDCKDIPEEELNKIIKFIEECLYQHRTEYVS
ncbi:MAG: hypothetical protein KAW81_04175 [Dehalococcoidia bacterium]|nr:hypothetical protein [Dehalococcoidia bacterium]